MPPYELSLILKASLQRPELVASIKRACERIFAAGGVIHKMENLGERELPYVMKAHHQSHTRGSYILMKFYSPAKDISLIMEANRQDFNVLRQGVIRDDKQFVRPCIYGPCQFGEVKLPLAERKAIRKKVLKKMDVKIG